MNNYAHGTGGYGELELPYLNDGLYNDAIAVQSARAALYLFLKSVKARSIYLPEYICKSILPSLNSLRLNIIYYSIDESLSPVGDFSIEKNGYFLLVNYFGICGQQIDSFMKDSIVKADSIIIDNSQALFEAPKLCAATIYSPRKFLGLPDGGFLVTKDKIVTPHEYYKGEKYCTHLLSRSAGEVESGYSYFLDSENTLNDFIPKRMSLISLRLVKSYDLINLKESRLKNFYSLHKEFGEINNLEFNRIIGVPLCYPLKLDFKVRDICERLVSSSIFLPRYWPNMHSLNSSSDLYENTLFLPIDHKIDEIKMNWLISKIKDEISI